MKLQSEIIQSDKLICSEKVLFNKIELNAKINTAIKTMAKDNLRSSIATILRKKEDRYKKKKRNNKKREHQKSEK